MEKEYKVSKDIAEKDFKDWCEANEIDCDMDMMNEEEKKDFEPLKKRIVKAIMEGRCVVDGDELKYTLSAKNEGGLSGKEIKVASPTGKTVLGLDGYKDTQGVHKLHGVMSALTGLDIGFFAKMRMSDWSFLQSVAQLFLSV